MSRFPLRHVAAAAVALASTASHASLVFGWDLNDWNPVVGQQEVVQLHAQLFNSPASTEWLRGDRLLAAVGEGIEDRYDFADAVPALADQLRDVVLAPGQSLDFVFGRLLPQGGEVDPGSYMGGGFGMGFADDSGRAVWWTPDHSLLVTVRDTGGGTVPEPSPLALLALAGAAALLLRGVRPSSPRCR